MLSHSALIACSLLLFSALTLSGCTCSKRADRSRAHDTKSVTVLRLESASPEQPGAEHCDNQGRNCTPLAVSQQLPRSGIVRTFAGGKLSLDLGHGKRLDLDGLSQTRLSDELVDLERGDFALATTPLIAKENNAELALSVRGTMLRPDTKRDGLTAFSVDDAQAQLTVRAGQLRVDGIQEAARAGESLRLTQATAFRTAVDGSELQPLLRINPQREDFAELLSETNQATRRGLGTMAARLPNTEQLRQGVELKAHHVRVTIENGFARTEVEEEFLNTTPHILEGQYRFPVPGDASLSRLALWVGDTLMEGEVLERKRAARIYSSIVDRPVPRDPALLEWISGGSLALKVFPILPQKTRKLVLAYEQALQGDGGRLRYTYPLSFGAAHGNRIAQFSIDVRVADDSARLSHPRSANYPLHIEESNGRYHLHYPPQGGVANDVTPTQDFELYLNRETANLAELTAALEEPSSQNAAGHFALRLQVSLPAALPRPGFDALRRAIVLDISHSQGAETLNAQKALALGLLREMDPEEEFILAACDSACVSMTSWDARHTQLAPKMAARMEQARAFLQSVKPGGSSDLSGALAAALVQLRRRAESNSSAGVLKNQVILISDGGVSSGDLSAQSIARRLAPLLSQTATQLRIVGAGRRIDTDTLRGLAIELDATWDLLPSGGSLTARIDELASIFRRPIIKNAKLRLPPGLISSDSLALPALYLGQELTMTGEIESQQPGDVLLQGELNGHPYALSRELDWKGTSSNNPMVPRLWARSRIALLQALEETPTRRAEIIALSEKYRTMSRYTSFLVLENDEMYRQFQVERRAIPSGARKAEAEEPPNVQTWDDAQPPAVQDWDAKEQVPERALPGDASASTQLGDDVSAEKGGQSSEAWQLGNAQGSAKPSAPAPRPAAAPPASDAGPRYSSAAAPAPAPAPAPRPASKSSSGCAPNDPMCSSFSGGGSGAPSKTSSARRYRPHVPSFHLSLQSADEAWRSWGEERITEQRKHLEQNPDSRALQEAYISSLLQNGRFEQARPSALRYAEIDPDNPKALRLLSYAAVADGDHELARLALDMLNEQSPREASLHSEAIESFAAVGDTVRACAHLRSLAELQPEKSAWQSAAAACWDYVLGERGSEQTLELGQAGQLRVSTKCDATTATVDCPSPVVVAPDGQVFSPWTPGLGKSSRSEVNLPKLRSGSYHVLIIGGAPSAQGTILVSGRNIAKNFRFESGERHTLAVVQVAYY